MATADAAASAGAAPVASTPDDGSVEICGHGRVKRSELEQQQPDHAPAWAKVVHERWEVQKAEALQRLAAGTPRERVAAALLRGDVNAAAELASGAEDGLAYRIALQACREDAASRVRAPLASSAPIAVAPAPVSCAALRLEKLEQLAPREVWPAMARLIDATRRRDAAAQSQLLHQLGQGTWQAGSQRPLTAVVAASIGVQPTPGEARLLNEATGADMLVTTQGWLYGVSEACRPRQLADANRRQLCEQVARRMPAWVVDGSDATALHALEKQLGLPHSPRSMSQDEGRKLQERMMAGFVRDAMDFSCAGFARNARQLKELAVQGELAFHRAASEAVR
ncbi:hypothetical protein [Roseateles asaccharophilus]|uniref:Uncharacterized protein n=1 Tax=Roseateles asaccharophilus TaxID=582607 RepID=A0ABU2A3E0_9BURK|nr:hypothetical protein [Roseateles asaccharophilus]MDR7331674.1 hypothetical protein [Roseateles asaccharophilus]